MLLGKSVSTAYLHADNRGKNCVAPGLLEESRRIRPWRENMSRRRLEQGRRDLQAERRRHPPCISRASSFTRIATGKMKPPKWKETSMPQRELPIRVTPASLQHTSIRGEPRGPSAENNKKNAPPAKVMNSNRCYPLLVLDEESRKENLRPFSAQLYSNFQRNASGANLLNRAGRPSTSNGATTSAALRSRPMTGSVSLTRLPRRGEVLAYLGIASGRYVDDESREDEFWDELGIYEDHAAADEEPFTPKMHILTATTSSPQRSFSSRSNAVAATSGRGGGRGKRILSSSATTRFSATPSASAVAGTKTAVEHVVQSRQSEEEDYERAARTGLAAVANYGNEEPSGGRAALAASTSSRRCEDEVAHAPRSHQDDEPERIEYRSSSQFLHHQQFRDYCVGEVEVECTTASASAGPIASSGPTTVKLNRPESATPTGRPRSARPGSAQPGSARPGSARSSLTLTGTGTTARTGAAVVVQPAASTTPALGLGRTSSGLLSAGGPAGEQFQVSLSTQGQTEAQQAVLHAEVYDEAFRKSEQIAVKGEFLVPGAPEEVAEDINVDHRYTFPLTTTTNSEDSSYGRPGGIDGEANVDAAQHVDSLISDEVEVDIDDGLSEDAVDLAGGSSTKNLNLRGDEPDSQAACVEVKVDLAAVEVAATWPAVQASTAAVPGPPAVVVQLPSPLSFGADAVASAVVSFAAEAAKETLSSADQEQDEEQDERSTVETVVDNSVTSLSHVVSNVPVGAAAQAPGPAAASAAETRFDSSQFDALLGLTHTNKEKDTTTTAIDESLKATISIGASAEEEGKKTQFVQAKPLVSLHLLTEEEDTNSLINNADNLNPGCANSSSTTTTTSAALSTTGAAPAAKPLSRPSSAMKSASKESNFTGSRSVTFFLEEEAERKRFSSKKTASSLSSPDDSERATTAPPTASDEIYAANPNGIIAHDHAPASPAAPLGAGASSSMVTSSPSICDDDDNYSEDDFEKEESPMKMDRRTSHVSIAEMDQEGLEEAKRVTDDRVHVRNTRTKKAAPAPAAPAASAPRPPASIHQTTTTNTKKPHVISLISSEDDDDYYDDFFDDVSSENDSEEDEDCDNERSPVTRMDDDYREHKFAYLDVALGVGHNDAPPLAKRMQLHRAAERRAKIIKRGQALKGENSSIMLILM
eukprot:CAMPEP_0178985138 /NCGR_PEP_ID=MMETSP0795-20121207/1989_1 /TAXON_ID=88552 /ORGANISM="Amoebophrya sp., Strain Ameob2" /LENGTH=1159 /DNA_ID=CAMNT_0020676069 /DNA_START=195 /DNA_END=3675 /DNA_ORIENTATION=-